MMPIPVAPDILVASNVVWEVAAVLSELPTEAELQRNGAEAYRAQSLAWREDGGGSALNVACALAQEGFHAAAVGQAGHDLPGQRALEALRLRGVHTHMRLAAERVTKTTAAFRQSHTDALVTSAWLPSGALPPLAASAISRPLLEQARVLHLDRPSEAAVQWAQMRCHNPISLDLHTFPFRGAAQNRALDLIRRATIVQINAQAVCALARALGVAAKNAAVLQTLSSCSESVHWITITCGAQGAVGWSAETGLLQMPPAAAPRCTDSTGAGDAFAAAMLAGWLTGSPYGETLKRAAMAGAEACTWLGARRPIAA